MAKQSSDEVVLDQKAAYYAECMDRLHDKMTVATHKKSSAYVSHLNAIISGLVSNYGACSTLRIFIHSDKFESKY